MSDRLLREYLSLVIEKIRTQKGTKSPLGDSFDINRFKKIDDLHLAVVYAERFLTKLGQGSSRSAFLLSSRYALKIAINEKGLAQNEAEVDVYTNPQSRPIVARIYSSGDANQWLIADLVKPLDNIEEFESLTGTDWVDEFGHWVADGIRNKQVLPGTPPFAKAVIQTALDNHLMFADLAQTDFSQGVHKGLLGHWGKTPDGRVVLLDYGYTEGVYDSHYRKKKATPPPESEKTNDMRPKAPAEVDDEAPTLHKERPPLTGSKTDIDDRRPVLSRTLKAGR